MGRAPGLGGRQGSAVEQPHISTRPSGQRRAAARGGNYSLLSRPGNRLSCLLVLPFWGPPGLYNSNRAEGKRRKSVN